MLNRVAGQHFWDGLFILCEMLLLVKSYKTLTYVCLMLHFFTGLLTICSLMHMNDLLYVHTGYV